MCPHTLPSPNCFAAAHCGTRLPDVPVELMRFLELQTLAACDGMVWGFAAASAASVGVGCLTGAGAATEVPRLRHVEDHVRGAPRPQLTRWGRV